MQVSHPRCDPENGSVPRGTALSRSYRRSYEVLTVLVLTILALTVLVQLQLDFREAAAEAKAEAAADRIQTDRL